MSKELLNNEHYNIIESLAGDDELKLRFSGLRQPIHTFYGGAQLFKRDTFEKIRGISLGIFTEYCEDSDRFREIFNLDSHPLQKSTTERVYHKILKKLETEAVEDYRIDFEDGFGYRKEEEEDEYAVSSAVEAAELFKEGTLPALFGIRIKPLSPGLAQRAVKTLELFISTFVAKSGGKLPPVFIVTLPKVSKSEQLSILNDALHKLEAKLHLPKHSILTEVMIETPEIIAEKYLAKIVQVGGNRLLGGHLGVYDLKSAFGVSGVFQQMQHPYCDYARTMMKIILGRSGIRCVDGVTNIMPVAPNKSTPASPLPNHLRQENIKTVTNGWRESYKDIRHSLRMGFYQGWDVHPGQIVSRLAAVYSFFIEEYQTSAKRMQGFLVNSAQATLYKGVFDDAASGYGLLNFFRYGFECGAFDENDLAGAGLKKQNLYVKHFVEITQQNQNA